MNNCFKKIIKAFFITAGFLASSEVFCLSFEQIIFGENGYFDVCTAESIVDGGIAGKVNLSGSSDDQEKPVKLLAANFELLKIILNEFRKPGGARCGLETTIIDDVRRVYKKLGKVFDEDLSSGSVSYTDNRMRMKQADLRRQFRELAEENGIDLEGTGPADGAKVKKFVGDVVDSMLECCQQMAAAVDGVKRFEELKNGKKKPRELKYDPVDWDLACGKKPAPSADGSGEISSTSKENPWYRTTPSKVGFGALTVVGLGGLAKTFFDLKAKKQAGELTKEEESTYNKLFLAAAGCLGVGALGCFFAFKK